MPNRKLTISIILIWLFNISGIIGILFEYQDWFIPLTPLHLLIYLILILWNSDITKKLFLGLMIPFFIGMIAEFFGVNYGVIFGNYTYGKNLGIKIFGVPWMIGVNWAILTYGTAAIAKKLSNRVVITSLIGAVLMVLLDILMEFSAPRFDFWEFEKGIIPIQNYIGWLIVAFVCHILFQKIIKEPHFILSTHIFLAIVIFFTTFLFF